MPDIADTMIASPHACSPEGNGQVVLVLQGGGALGAYQAGVYQALHEAGIEPDWVIGTSIGAINASLIAGSAPEDRLRRLTAFWTRVQYDAVRDAVGSMPLFGSMMANWLTMTSGIAGFFRPNPRAYAGVHTPLGADKAGLYSTEPLAGLLAELVDFDRINAGPTRLTVGAAHVRSATMRYFDSRDMRLGSEHVMASGALPPAFPAVRIDGELYWDGGILSNTPIEAVFDDFPRRSGLVFAVHIWNPEGPEPESIWQVMSRQKDIQYSSRVATHIGRQKELHRLRHVIAELSGKLPEERRDDPDIAALARHGCLTRMHVVRLVAPAVEGEDHTKDIDFSGAAIRARWEAGYGAARRVLRLAPWRGAFDPMEGVILHEAHAGAEMISG